MKNRRNKRTQWLANRSDFSSQISKFLSLFVYTNSPSPRKRKHKTSFCNYPFVFLPIKNEVNLTRILYSLYSRDAFCQNNLVHNGHEQLLCNHDSCLQKMLKRLDIFCPLENVACVHNTCTVVSNGITFFQPPVMFLSESRQSAPLSHFP